MTKPVRLAGDLGGWPVYLDDYDSDGPCGATLPSDWPMLSAKLVNDLERWNSAWISNVPGPPWRRRRAIRQQLTDATELAVRLQAELGDDYVVTLRP